LKEFDYNSNEEPVEEYKDLTNQLIEELTDENDHSAVDVIKAMLITRDVKMFKVAAAKWIKREEQGYL
jgi:chorismate mutase